MLLFMLDLPQVVNHNFSLNISDDPESTVSDVLRGYIELLTDETGELDTKKIESILSKFFSISAKNSAMLREINFNDLKLSDMTDLMKNEEFITDEISNKVDSIKGDIFEIINDLSDSIKDTGIVKDSDDEYVEQLAKFVLASLLFAVD